MDTKKMMRIFEDTAYVRMGGTCQEKKTAEYLRRQLEQMGLKATIEAFDVDMGEIHEAGLECDGIHIPCKGYMNAGSAQVEAPFYYLRNRDDYSLSCCRGKIVMVDGYMGYWIYQDLLENGAVGFITYDGNANYQDRNIDQRELRSFVSRGRKIPGVNINAKDAIALIKRGTASARICLKQDESVGQSHNVVLELPGELPQFLTFSAHYDSTSLSCGAYDNMSGCVGLLAMAEYFSGHPHRYGLRFVWCGSEERGLLGSKAYCAAHEQELKDCVLNINLDMIGSVMGKFVACVTAEEKLMHCLSYFGLEQGFGLSVSQNVYPSDSTPFADCGVPAVTFARDAPGNTATIHNSYDTVAVLQGSHMQEDIGFIQAFADRMANAARCPVSRTMPENMKEKLDVYLCRKRGEQ